MSSDLLAWAQADSKLYNTNSVYNNICQFQPISQAIIDLLTLSNYYDETSVVGFITMATMASGVTSDWSGCNDSSFDPIDRIIQIYSNSLVYLLSKQTGVTPTYESYISTVDNQLNQIIINYFQDANALPNNEIVIGYNKISATAFLTEGNQIGCICGSFCTVNTIAIEVHITYMLLGYYSDIVSLHFYSTGTQTCDTATSFCTYKFYEVNSAGNPIATIDTPGCLSLQQTICASAESNGRAVISADTTCAISSQSTTSVNIDIKGMGLCEVYSLCGSGYATNSNYLCEVCGSGCLCTVPAGCNSCTVSNYQVVSSANPISCQCISPFTISGGDCVCPGGTYQSGLACDNCMDHCLECTGSSSCSQCDSSHGFEYIGSVCACPDEKFNDSGTCTNCESDCKVCTDTSSCTTCNDGFYHVLTQCLPCPAGEFLSGSTCVACGTGCEVCTSATECTNCYSAFTGSGGVCSCAAASYPSGEDCCSCMAHCSDCVDGTSCAQCNTGYFFVTGSCVEGYPYLTADQISSFKFNVGFSYLTLTFVNAMETTSSTECTSYFADISSLGSSPSCYFTSPTSMKILLGPGFTITEATSLTIKYSLLTVSGPLSAGVADFPITPTSDYPKTAPVAIISGPASVSPSCGYTSLVYSSSLSYGIGDKTFTYSWSVDQPSLVLFSGASSPSISVSSIDASVTAFKLTLTLTSVFGESKAYLTATVSSSGLLLLGIDTGDLVMESSKSKMVQGLIVQKCGNAGVINFYWDTGSAGGRVITTGSKAYIRAGSLSVGSYTLTLTATLTTSTGTVVVPSNAVSCSITIVQSKLVAVMDSQGGQVSSRGNLVISGAKSYDPDGSIINTYFWSATGSVVLQNKYTSTVTVESSALAAVSSFSLTLTITADSRTASVTSTFTVGSSGITFTNVDFDNQKVAVWKKLTIISAAQYVTSSELGASYLWSKAFGLNSISLVNPTYSFLTVLGNSLTPGYGYIFQIATTSNSVTLDNYVAVNVNIGPTCLSSLSASPTSGTARSTAITFSISQCYDQDGEDYPLTYAYAFSEGSASGHLYTLGLPLGLQVFTTTFGEAGTFYGSCNVCDALKDCQLFSTGAVSISAASSGRRLRREGEEL